MDTAFSIPSTEIQYYVSFKYPYLLVDSIKEVVPGVHAIGSKNFTWNEWFFPIHFENDPMVPGNLIAEAMGQVLGFTIQSFPEYKQKKAFLISTDKCRFFNKVRPGDTLITKATVKSFRRGLLTGHCECEVDGIKIAIADISLLVEGIQIATPQSNKL